MMVQPMSPDDLITIEDVERRYGVKRSTLYRYIRKGDLSTYRRAMDKRVYVRPAEIEALRRFRRLAPREGLRLAAVERARAFQRQVFADRALATPSAELIEEARRERAEELP